ncbi:hypothetical protein CLF_113106 [Clonorchis sinensis]|uniref:Uncharacterized protein n=1 Tax=Clonorchis sinensis TaxID=79923 RepID=G7YXM7_CLOSI|nr:hypothetical protein CLF_113106 [Clonorchis sinensis]
MDKPDRKTTAYCRYRPRTKFVWSRLRKALLKADGFSKPGGYAQQKQPSVYLYKKAKHQDVEYRADAEYISENITDWMRAFRQSFTTAVLMIFAVMISEEAEPYWLELNGPVTVVKTAAIRREIRIFVAAESALDEEIDAFQLRERVGERMQSK